MRRILVVFAIVCAIIDTGCAGGRAPDVAPSMTYEELTERWAAASLSRVQEVLRANPPDGGDSVLRAEALLALDEPLHLRDAPRMVPVGDFLRSNIDRAIAEMRSEKVTGGATIWKLYNHGWIVRTANHTWAHDFVEGIDSVAMTGAQVDAILDQVDALFISHWHGDHESPRMIRRALDCGVPVFAPPFPRYDYIRHVQGVIGYSDSATAPAGFAIVEPGVEGEIRGIRYHAYPGHQGALENNIMAVEADGITVVHTGDQTNTDDYPMIDGIGDAESVDVLLPHVLQNYVRRIAQGIRPRYVIPGHECEIGHGFESREPYDQAYRVIDGERNWVIMTWGERFPVPARDDEAESGMEGRAPRKGRR